MLAMSSNPARTVNFHGAVNGGPTVAEAGERRLRNAPTMFFCLSTSSTGGWREDQIGFSHQAMADSTPIFGR